MAGKRFDVVALGELPVDFTDNGLSEQGNTLFEKPEDIMKVNGIKEGMYEKIKDSISVN